MRNRKIRIIILLSCCVLLMPHPAMAASTSDAVEPILPENDCSLMVSYCCEETAIQDLEVKLYRIAEVSADFQYTLTPTFASSGLVLDGIRTAGEWNVVRSTLEAYILAYNLAPEFTSLTNADGTGSFASLKTGMYLAIAGQAEENGVHYMFDSALISLPGLGPNGRWQYQVNVSPKPDMLPPISPDEIIQLKVLKLWKGETDQSVRPRHIEVEIYRNGVLDRTVTLSEDNHWSYTWTVPKDNADWVVIERNVPDGYVVTMEERQTTFLLINTWQPDQPPPGPNPPRPNPPGGNPPGENPPSVTPPSDSPDTGDTPHIMLYTVLMYLSGAVLVLLGITGKRKRT